MEEFCLRQSLTFLLGHGVRNYCGGHALGALSGMPVEATTPPGRALKLALKSPMVKELEWIEIAQLAVPRFSSNRFGLLLRNEYLAAENRILKAQIKRMQNAGFDQSKRNAWQGSSGWNLLAVAPDNAYGLINPIG
jgi:hypothetical protein